MVHYLHQTIDTGKGIEMAEAYTEENIQNLAGFHRQVMKDISWEIGSHVKKYSIYLKRVQSNIEVTDMDDSDREEAITLLDKAISDIEKLNIGGIQSLFSEAIDIVIDEFE